MNSINIYSILVLPRLLYARGYILETTARTWVDANNWCLAEYGTHLATLTTDSDISNALTLRDNAGHHSSYLWIGLNDQDTEGHWLWIDGTSCDYAPAADCINDVHWPSGEPNNANSNGHCALIWSNDIQNILKDDTCSKSNPFLCNDGVISSNSLYVLIFEALSWSDANTYCLTMYSTHLATIITDDAMSEALQLRSKVGLDDTYTDLWIGLNDETVEGQWEWADGTTCVYAGGDCVNDVHWADTEPNNYDHGNETENCVSIRQGVFDLDQSINDLPCSRTTSFICNVATHFDSYIMITYILGNLAPEDITLFRNNLTKTLKYIETKIKDNYFDLLLSYDQFMIDIEFIDDIAIENIDMNTKINWENANELTLGTEIECDQEPTNTCETIRQKSQIRNDFADDVTSDLRSNTSYFDNENLVFSVQEPESLQIKSKYPDDESPVTESPEYIYYGESPNSPEYIYYGLASICGLIILVSVCALLFNKKKFPHLPGFHVVDDGKWNALLLFALQFWDFSSDVNLSVEIWSRDDLRDNILILLSAIGSVLFTLIPYVANLIIASRVKQIIKDNEAAKSWFQSNSALFTILVVLTGGCYPAMALISSSIFGLEIMTSGLTVYELKQLNKIKVFATVFLENVPQLIVQAVYCSAINAITDSVQVAFFGSLLSVTATTLGYFIERHTNDMEVVEYYLSTQCVKRRSVNNTQMNPATSSNSIGQDGVVGDKDTAPAALDKALSDSQVASDQITDDEKEHFISNRGRRHALSEGIAELFEISPKNIEIGYSTITKYGIITHIVHYISQLEIHSLQQQLQNEDIVVSAAYYAQTLYSSMKKEINTIFIEHFELSDDFEVKYIDQMTAVGASTKMRALSVSESDNNEQRTAVLKKMEMDIGTVIAQLMVERGYFPTKERISEFMKIISKYAKRVNINELEESVSLSFSEEKEQNEVNKVLESED